MGEDGSDRRAQGGVLTGETPPLYRDLRLYGRRQDKGLKPRQARLMEALLPKIAVTPETVRARIADHDGPVWLEVGFGGGEHLAWQAERNPDVLFVGAEPFLNGAAKLLGFIDERGLSNVAVCHGDARTLMMAMPAACVARGFVLHPDPWPKRKHFKRRIISQPFLSELHRLLVPGAVLRVASDIPDYVRWTLMQIQIANREAPRWTWTASREADWRVRPDDWPETRYEAKGIREGRADAYLSFTRV